MTTCCGLGVVLGVSRRGGSPSSRAIEFSLASQLGELEAGGRRLPVVGLAARRTSDSEPLLAAIPWLAARGRQIFVSTRVRLPVPLVAALAEAGASVQLEVASVHNHAQAALLGTDALPVLRLLLHAQELAARGVATGVRLGPLVSGWHEHVEPLRPMLRHIAAADVRSLTFNSSPLRPAQVQALFGGGHPPEPEWVAPELRHSILEATARREAAAAGLIVDACGCGAHCQLAVPARSYVPVAAPELFPCAS